VEGIEVLIELEVGELTPSDPAYRVAGQDFISFARHSSDIRLIESPEAGKSSSKGTWDQLLLSVASPSAAAAAVALFRLWLQRDRRRSIKVEIRAAGSNPIQMTAEGDNVSLDVLQKALTSTLDASRQLEK
jgi:hypothetical protein